VARRWTNRSPSHLVCGFALVSMMIVGAIEVAYHGVDTSLRVARQNKVQLTDDVARLQRGVAKHPVISDFTRGLPLVIKDVSLNAQIQATAAATSVSLVSLVSAEHAASPRTLAYGEWALTLRGTYPNIKTLLAQLLHTVPDLRVYALKLKRINASDIEAQVSLVQWLRPLDAVRAEAKD
jgi:hypothetical protein